MEAPPIRAVNGRVIVRELEYKPSKMLEVVSIDRADRTDGIVIDVAPFKYGRRKVKGGWELTNVKLEQDVKPGDRVIFKPKYVGDDVIILNQVTFRSLDPWEIEAIVDAPQPEGFCHPVTGEKLSDAHPIHLIGA